MQRYVLTTDMFMFKCVYVVWLGITCDKGIYCIGLPLYVGVFLFLHEYDVR